MVGLHSSTRESLGAQLAKGVAETKVSDFNDAVGKTKVRSISSTDSSANVKGRLIEMEATIQHMEQNQGFLAPPHHHENEKTGEKTHSWIL